MHEHVIGSLDHGDSHGHEAHLHCSLKSSKILFRPQGMTFLDFAEAHARA